MSEKAKYLDIENDIIEKISNGIYKDGEKIPSEFELVQIYECSRVTVRHALSDLRYMGYIYSLQGAGSYVTSKKKIVSSETVKPFSENIQLYDAEKANNVLRFEIISVSRQLASLLNISPSEKAFYIERVRSINGRPVILERKYLPAEKHSYLSYQTVRNSIYLEAEEHGHPVDHVSCSVLPVFPDEEIADALLISANKPILKVTVRYYEEDGSVFGYGEEYYNTDYYQLNFSRYR